MTRAHTLGAIVAGGRSSRFGSDKALAPLAGEPLLAHVVRALGAHCDAVVIIGRESELARSIADWPRPGLGPLGGLAGAMRHAIDRGFDQVLSCGVDGIGLPGDIIDRLSPAPAYVASQPVIGLWPATAHETLEDMIHGGAKLSVRGFAERIGARAVELDTPPANINTPEDLARLEKTHGL
ncbi:molybdenum cofactor guanylyltransferase [Sphingomonas colocasiae]|uniref:Molybdenum cofactor guanylyltransferase n=1 Tax=Sphingomonas colocasiae TaxID=1848973 RepID=A0ABS7PRZ8_9SPHN|nr:molybdenum cofactor guanylyltransferase [Sphingomonas colocasiae]MBY8824046.1 molybdenum cofactor guanylyltransferase [Sphingomonas colocasiae]